MQGLSDRLCPSVVVGTKIPSSPDPGRFISAKYFQTVEKLPCLCFILLDTLYICLKSCILSWCHGHTYQHHPDTWPPVQCETMVCSYPQGSTRIATWRAEYVLYYRALVSMVNVGTISIILTGSCRFCFTYNRSCKIMFTNNIPCLQYKLSCMFTNNNKDQSGWRI